ncbi:MAG: hypothetical protein K2N44_12985 [Lachnospiraceae bacterium]|nr:hypothetical protein [Lachnospiraceae bacterium]
MKRANKNFRREMLAAGQQMASDIKRYPLNYDKCESVTIYSSNNVTISCSSNLFESEE